MKRKHLLAVLLSLALLIGALPMKAAAVEDAPETVASAVVVMDAYSGQIIYEKNADEERPIASVTKVMTGYLATQNMTVDDPKLDEVITVSKKAADADGIDGTSMYLEAGQAVTYEELLYGTMLRSGNDAAVALGEACTGGDIDQFVQLMNDTAAELGMTHTHYSCANGLIDEDNYSSARDQAILARAAMENELFAKVVGTWYIELGSFQIENHNELLQTMRGECLGVKTGFTTLAGRTLVTCAQRDGSKFIIVTLNDQNWFEDHQVLYEWAFRNYPANVLCVEGNAVTTLRIGEMLVPLTAAQTLVASVPASSDNVIECEITLPSQVSGAISRGAVAGKVTYWLNGEELGTVDLLYSTIVVN